MQMFKCKKQGYESENYKQWITLPPKMSIPYNQNFIFVLTLQFQNLSYLNTFISHKIDPKRKTEESSGNQGKQNKSDFKIKTYWWGEQHGYQSLMKTMILNNNDILQNQPLSQNEIMIKRSNKTKESFRYQPVRFLVCCPLDNFLKYCLDMKVLKIQFVSAESNIILAKTYLNFLTLSSSWKGEPTKLLLPLFSPNQSGRPFVNKPTSPQIVGQISLDIKIQQIANPFKILPESLSSVKRFQVQSTDNKFNSKTQQKMKQNSSEQSNTVSKHKSTKQVNNKLKKQNSFKTSSQVQNFQLSQQQRQINDSQIDQQILHQENIKNQQKFYRNQNQRIKTLKPVTIQSLMPGYEKITIPKHNFQSQKIQLNEDFKMIFAVKNKFYQQIFSQNSTNKTQNSYQTIQFKLQLIQNLNANGIQKQLHFQHIKISVPILYSLFSSQTNYKMNEYLIVQKQGVIKLRLETGKFQAKQIQKFIRSAELKVQIIYKNIERKQNEGQIKGKKNVVQSQKDNITVFSGSLSLLDLLSKSGIPNKLNVLTSNKRFQNIFEFYITALPKQIQQPIQKVQENKNIIKQNKQFASFYVWLKIVKFIPINSNYFRDANIFIKIALIKKNLHQQKVEMIEIAQTNTQWKPFEERKSICKFYNQVITFPIEMSSQQQDILLRLQVMNRKQKSVKMGESIFAVNDQRNPNKECIRGRLQVKVKNVKMQTIGHLQCWFQKGDVNYINKLTIAHFHKKDSNISINKQHDKKQNRKQVEKNKKIQQKKQQQESLSESQSFSENYLSSSSDANLSQTSQQKFDKKSQENNQIGDEIFEKFWNQMNKQEDMLIIHNRLFLHIIVAINNQKIQKNHFENFKNINKNNIHQQSYMTFNLFIEFISSIIALQHQNKQILTQRKDNLMQKIKKNGNCWVNRLFQFYCGYDNEIQGGLLLNFSQFEDSFEAFITFYRQIIEEKDEVFKKLLDVLNIASIQIRQIQEDLQYEVSKINNRKGVNLVTEWKNRIMDRILRGSRVQFDRKINIQTVLQRFFIFYSQRVQNLLKEQINLVSEICDQLRKFELYETTYTSEVQDQYFRSYISKSIRDLLQIDYYLPANQLMEIVEQNQIQLSKWEILNLSTQKELRPKHNNNKQGIMSNKKQRDQQKEKVIVKSPTFGILQHLHNLNPKPSSYNPSFLESNRKPKPLNISELSQGKKQGDRSEILRKKIELISPINNINIKRVLISGKIANKNDLNNSKEAMSLINPSSIIFSNPHTSSVQNKTNSINPYEDYSNLTQNITCQQDGLVVGVMEMKRKVNWIRIGKNTYFVQNKKDHTINITQQPINNQQTHSNHVKEMSGYEVQKIEKSHLQQMNNQCSHLNSSQQHSVSKDNIKQINKNQQESHNFKQNTSNNQISKSKSDNILSSDNLNKNQSSVFDPIFINLQGLVPKTEYNLVLGIQMIQREDVKQSFKQQIKANYQQTEEIFINCEHGIQEKVIDQTGTQIGSLIVCLLSDIHHSFSKNGHYEQ